MTFDDSFKALLSGSSLSREEAESAMHQIMTGEVLPVKLAGWLVALRIKGETPAEIAGCAAAMRSQAIKLSESFPDAVDTCGTGGDGLHTINISTAAAFVASGAGVKVAKHGNKAVSSRSGSADVLESLGVNIAAPVESSAKCLREIGLAFLFAPSFHPAMKHAAPVRRELGIRTIFNILGPLSNPAGAKRAVLGVFSDQLCLKMAGAAKELGFERMLAVHGSDGLDEITLSGPTRICEIRDGEICDYLISPSDFGIPRAKTSELCGGSPAENAEQLKAILEGRLKGPKRDVVALNAAAAILVSDIAGSWQEAILKAEDSINSGAASEKLAKLVEATR